jgi:hypothetical protein
MQTIDFARSFFTFRIDHNKKPPATASHKARYTLNNARIPIECRCRITEKATGGEKEFSLGASCKTERVGVEEGIWTQPNADFAPIFSSERFLVIKTFDHAGRKVMLYPESLGEQPHRQIGDVADAFDSVRIDHKYVEAETLDSAPAIVNAVLENRPLVATTTLQNDRYTAVVEYPIKTINANERDWTYQTDSGPVLVPDLSRPPEKLIDGLELAYSAFNCRDWIEFLVRAESAVGQGVEVMHYSRPERFNAKNEVAAHA